MKLHCFFFFAILFGVLVFVSYVCGIIKQLVNMILVKALFLVFFILGMYLAYKAMCEINGGRKWVLSDYIFAFFLCPTFGLVISGSAYIVAFMFYQFFLCL